MPKPRNSLAGKHFANNGTKAPKLPQGKKKNSRVPAENNQGGDQSSGGGGGAGKKGGRGSKKSQRSILGFVLGAAACVGLWSWGIFQGVEKRKRDRKILDRMLRRPLAITEHAECRMDCRFITKDQINESLRKGRINDRKSDPNERPCPKYVVDAEVPHSTNGSTKAVQGVFSACRNETWVITVIDTETAWPCGPC